MKQKYSNYLWYISECKKTDYFEQVSDMLWNQISILVINDHTVSFYNDSDL